MTTPWYDDIKQMEPYCHSLEKFLELCLARSIGSHDRSEKLGNFVVMGTWHLDSFGQVGRMSEIKKYDDIARQEYLVKVDFPVICFSHEVQNLLPAGVNWGFGFGYNSSPPPANIFCPECKKTWSMENAGDYIREDDSVGVDATSFIGKSMKEARDFFKNDGSARYFMRKSICLRNDRFIDLTPHPEYAGMLMNDKGYAGSDGSHKRFPQVDFDSYVIQPGDELVFDKTWYRHTRCHLDHISAESRTKFEASITAAGFKVIGAIRQPNEYGSLLYRGPWWLFDTDMGVVKVGWRKRVIQLDFSKVDSSYIVTDDSVTKSAGMVHADNHDQLTSYLMEVRANAKPGAMAGYI